MIPSEGRNPVTVFKLVMTQIIEFICSEFILLRLRLSEGVGS